MRMKSRKVSPRALVVDDDPKTASSVLAVLGHLGWEVTVAFHGRDAIELLQKGEFALLVLDWVMPEFGGGKVIEAMCAPKTHGLHEIPVVIHTGMSAGEVQLPEGANRLSRIAFLQKPSGMADLARIISNIYSR